MMKKGVAFLLSIAMIFSMTACGGSEKSSDLQKDIEVDGSRPGWEQFADDKVTLDWYVNYSWFNTTWGENLVSKTITEETGIDVNFVVPAGNESEKLNSMIATDTLPDIITLGYWEGQINDMIDADMIYPLNELADAYDPYFWEVADESRCNWYTKEDGNLYCYPNSSYSPEDYEKYDNIGSNQTFLVRKDIYEAIGSPDMSTPEGFKQAIRDVAEKFPEVDGQPLIPIGADEFTDSGCNSFDQWLMNFLAVPHEKDGKYYDRYTDPEYVAWLKAFRELGEEGYLANDIFIDKRAQMEEKIAQGRYFCMIYQRTDIQNQEKQLYAENPDKVYIAVDGPKNSNGADPQLPGSSVNGWTVTMITKNCENPDRAIQFLTYFMSEHGQKMIYLGVEGETYDMVDGKAVVRDDVLALLQSDRTEYDKQYGADDAYWMLQDNAMQLQWMPELVEPMKQLEEWTYPYTVYAGQYDVSFATDSSEAIADLKIKNEWGSTLPKLLLASSEKEFDELLQTFVEKRDGFDYDLVMEESTRQMVEAKEKLGMK
ncbi:MAG: extracellular solute-binding protein [Lachnospiraceae bacterium]